MQQEERIPSASLSDNIILCARIEWMLPPSYTESPELSVLRGETQLSTISLFWFQTDPLKGPERMHLDGWIENDVLLHILYRFFLWYYLLFLVGVAVFLLACPTDAWIVFIAGRWIFVYFSAVDL